MQGAGVSAYHELRSLLSCHPKQKRKPTKLASEGFWFNSRTPPEAVSCYPHLAPFSYSWSDTL